MININEIIDKKIADTLEEVKVIGIDIGSRTGKAVLLAGGLVYTAKNYTGLNMKDTAQELIDELEFVSGVNFADVDYVVATGYGRIALNFEDKPCRTVTEISCHALGIHALDARVKTIIDIGGQDSKAIRVDPLSGKVEGFVLNDKCAAGTGRFLERVAELLEVRLDKLGELVLQAENPSQISSQCVVFAESEVVSYKAKGAESADIAAGIHYATARRICNQVSRIGLERGLAFSGGVSNNIGMKKVLEDVLQAPVVSLPIDCIYAGALGAAIHARQFLGSGSMQRRSSAVGNTLPLQELEELLEEKKSAIIAKKDGKKNVGYLCNYTPLEIMGASGAFHFRLFQRGDADVVASGEQLTQSFFCEFIKSLLGAFKEGVPLYKALDKVYTFYTCDCIKIASEGIDNFFVPSDTYVLPRLKAHTPSLQFFKSQLLEFKKDLEALTGAAISDEKLRERIKLYNEAKAILRRISELRKRDDPPLTGSDYLELVKYYFYLEPEVLIPVYRRICDALSAAPERGEKKIRLMISGGVFADGDRRLLELVEKEIGARVVVEDHCTGFRGVDYRIAEKGDPLDAIAEGYVTQPPCARMKPLQERVDYSGKLALEYQVDGVLYSYLKFCPCYGQSKQEFFRHFQKIGVPVLEVARDYSRSDEGQLKTRLEAFIEVLSERKVA
ncbi:MAG: acyl-CoA dehydratase activase [Synergistaceae bacterium]|jgi:predicted CoA-substrate-specific enzyme activase|nr:acyl-CoA dehydratase activase [Synergistaceae bacterium]